MARIRSFKPDFWGSDQVNELSIAARLLFMATWTFADDYGRGVFSPRFFKRHIFAADDVTSEQVTGMFRELEKHKLVQLYEAEGEQYYWVTGWKHQRIEKPGAAKYPKPPGTLRRDRIGEDRKGEERETPISPPAPSGSISETFSANSGQAELPIDDVDPLAFDLIWEIYTKFGDKASSKWHARAAFRKLTHEERNDLFGAVARYGEHVMAERKRSPDYRVRHLDTFITEKVYESFQLPTENGVDAEPKS